MITLVNIYQYLQSFHHIKIDVIRLAMSIIYSYFRERQGRVEIAAGQMIKKIKTLKKYKIKNYHFYYLSFIYLFFLFIVTM